MSLHVRENQLKKNMCAKRDHAVDYVCYIPQLKFKQSKKLLKIVTSLNVRERTFILKYQRPVNKNKLWTKNTIFTTY